MRNSNPSPNTGTVASQSNIAAGEHQHFFQNATTTLAVGTGDVLYAYVYVDPANPPSELMLQWNDGSSWEHRAYWGSASIAWGTPGGWQSADGPASLGPRMTLNFSPPAFSTGVVSSGPGLFEMFMGAPPGKKLPGKIML